MFISLLLLPILLWMLASLPIIRPVKSRGELIQLAQRVSLYKRLSPLGWSHFERSGDGVLFTSLLHVGKGEEFPIELVEDEPGKLVRNPNKEPDGRVVDAGSDISRDMFAGIFWYLHVFRKKELAERIYSFGKKNRVPLLPFPIWKMGREWSGRVGENRVYLTPQGISLLAQIIHSLGGKSHLIRHFPAGPYSTTPGYLSHLTLLTIALRGRVLGKISLIDYLALRGIARKNPLNPLAQALLAKYGDGDQSLAIGLLLSTYPPDRLPTTRDWHEAWRIQRADSDKGLEPNLNDPATSHSGGDFLFTSALILDTI